MQPHGRTPHDRVSFSIEHEVARALPRQKLLGLTRSGNTQHGRTADIRTVGTHHEVCHRILVERKRLPPLYHIAVAARFCHLARRRSRRIGMTHQPAHGLRHGFAPCIEAVGRHTAIILQSRHGALHHPLHCRTGAVIDRRRLILTAGSRRRDKASRTHRRYQGHGCRTVLFHRLRIFCKMTGILRI